ncbi:MarR family winged helix-turn-helix transcriptional regulator [Microbacterium sp. C7(2022)]|uniref:MarR family winged helix-turn-helix transcriptional regulator n=1 Tax=Microbacterium sp. C7(2022) TaxID=2992759 RepID=UPI00237C4C42|nr:MarR family winged helix-turn-helix transcriptional regulator [Microbacterium sp. C7(2022)]MDE0547626.1 MarR family winged helix-turn-helix transcriptional regulator [Microbacterium sp. C7(2022)]
MTEPVSTDHTSALSKAVCLALYSTANATLQLYRDLLAPWGLSYQQLMVLIVLWEEEVATPGHLADTLMLDSSSVAGLLRRMQRDGLIERSTDAADRRRVLVTATAAGHALRDQLGPVAECLGEAVPLDERSAAELISQLDTLRASLVAYERPAAASLTAHVA